MIEPHVQEYRNELVRILEKSNDAFEKQLSYISSGAIGVSMLLVERLFANLSAPTHKWLLTTGWIVLAITLLINLISHLISFRSNFKTIEEIDSETYQQGKAKRRNGIIIIVNWLSAILLFLGIILIVVFISINI